jgi:hypothetical protein
MIRSFVIFAMFAASLASAQDAGGNWMAIPSDSGALRHLQCFVLKLTRSRQGTMYAGAFGGGDAEKKQGAKRHN